MENLPPLGPENVRIVVVVFFVTRYAGSTTERRVALLDGIGFFT